MAAAMGEISSIPLQMFPQPSRPLHAPCEPDRTSSHSTEAENRNPEEDRYSFDGLIYNLEENPRTESESESESGDIVFDECSDDDDDLDLRVFLAKLDKKRREVFKKLVSEVENDVPLEKLFRETLHYFKGKAPVSKAMESLFKKVNSDQSSDDHLQRGVNGDFSSSKCEELKHKLERFKVKTVNIIGTGIVKEERR